MKTTKDPGLGTKFVSPVRRFMNPDGSYNIKRVGGLSNYQDFYKHLVDISWLRFLAYTAFFYVAINLFFTLLYLLLGVDQLISNDSLNSPFLTAFFFSVQTFTTVGYGYISPSGVGANVIAVIEAFVGLMCFALATGLLYGRFSKPKVKISFSKQVILTPFEDGLALMFKMVNKRKNVLLNTKVDVLFIIDKGGGDADFNKEYYAIDLENNQVNFFPLTWTLVHKITTESPFAGLNVEELDRRNAELVILVETFDETYGQKILQKHSYAHGQWREGVRFDRSFRSNAKGQIELFVDEIDHLLPVE